MAVITRDLVHDLAIDLAAVALAGLFFAIFAGPIIFGLWRGREAQMLAPFLAAHRKRTLTMRVLLIQYGAWVAVGVVIDGAAGGLSAAVTITLGVAVIVGLKRAMLRRRRSSAAS